MISGQSVLVPAGTACRVSLPDSVPSPLPPEYGLRMGKKEPARQLLLRNSNDLLHLSEDAQIAEELAIRYSDSFISRGECLRCGNEGPAPLTEVHRVRSQCQMELFATIADTHGVTNDQVDQSRERRDIRFDIAVVFFPMAVFSGVHFSYGCVARVWPRHRHLIGNDQGHCRRVSADSVSDSQRRERAARRDVVRLRGSFSRSERAHGRNTVLCGFPGRNTEW